MKCFDDRRQEGKTTAPSGVVKNAVLVAEGISEDETLKDFKQWRGGKRK